MRFFGSLISQCMLTPTLHSWRLGRQGQVLNAPPGHLHNSVYPYSTASAMKITHHDIKQRSRRPDTGCLASSRFTAHGSRFTVQTLTVLRSQIHGSRSSFHGVFTNHVYLRIPLCTVVSDLATLERNEALHFLVTLPRTSVLLCEKCGMCTCTCVVYERCRDRRLDFKKMRGISVVVGDTHGSASASATRSSLGADVFGHTHAELLNGELLFRLDHAGGHLLERGEFWTVRRILKRGRTAS